MTLNCTWRDMMREAADALLAAGVESASRDARLLLALAFGIEPVEVIMRETDAIDPVTLAAFNLLIGRRKHGEPVSRIRGWKEFYGRIFVVTPDVLDPRPETELLVEQGLARLPRGGRVLDLGTGSGCILVSVLAERSDTSGVGLDISPGALAVARRNAETLGVASRATFIEGSWEEEFPPLSKGGSAQAKLATGGDHLSPRSPVEKTPAPTLSSAKSERPPLGGGGSLPPFNLILSNPPYLADAELASLARDVRDCDPKIALVSGPDGLEAYRAILLKAPRWLKPGGWIGFEFAATQAAKVRDLMQGAGLADIIVFRDLAGHERAAFGRSQ